MRHGVEIEMIIDFIPMKFYKSQCHISLFPIVRSSVSRLHCECIVLCEVNVFQKY